jgi:hypothetical protein
MTMGKFKEGDILIDKLGNRYKVEYVSRDRDYPYTARCIAGEWVGNVDYFGANGEYRGTGNAGSTLDVTLDPDYMVNKMWEKWDNGV